MSPHLIMAFPPPHLPPFKYTGNPPYLVSPVILLLIFPFFSWAPQTSIGWASKPTPVEPWRSPPSKGRFPRVGYPSLRF